jgi:NitT/TauT family transport system substrate-binding protein
MKLNRTRVASLTATLVALGALAACGEDSSAEPNASASGSTSQAPSAEPAQLKVMMYPGQSNRLPIIVGQEEGFFEGVGLEVEIVEQPNQLTATQALEATDSQITPMSLPSLAAAIEAQGGTADVGYFCGLRPSDELSIMAPEGSDLPAMSEGESWEDVLGALEGKKIGIPTPPGAGFALQFIAALEEAGVEDATYVNVGAAPATIEAVLKNESVDVAVAFPPGTQQFITKGSAKQLIVMSDGPSMYKDAYASGWAGPKSWIEGNPEQATAFCDAYGQALEFINDPANLAEATAYTVEAIAIDEAAAELMVENTFPSWTQDLPEAAIDFSLQSMKDVGVLKTDLSFDDVVIAAP